MLAPTHEATSIATAATLAARCRGHRRVRLRCLTWGMALSVPLGAPVVPLARVTGDSLSGPGGKLNTSERKRLRVHAREAANTRFVTIERSLGRHQGACQGMNGAICEGAAA